MALLLRVDGGLKASTGKSHFRVRCRALDAARVAGVERDAERKETSSLSQAFVQLHRLCKSYGPLTAVSELSLEIADSRLGRVELFLQRGGLIGGGEYLLRHQRIIVDDGALF